MPARTERHVRADRFSARMTRRMGIPAGATTFYAYVIRSIKFPYLCKGHCKDLVERLAIEKMIFLYGNQQLNPLHGINSPSFFSKIFPLRFLAIIMPSLS